MTKASKPATTTTDIHAASNAVIAKAMAKGDLETTKAAPTNGVLNSKRVAHFIDARAIMRRPGWNPRFDFGEIDGLATSLAANGMLNPIRVKRIEPTVLDDGKGKTGTQVFLFELIDGDRRLSALEHLMSKGKFDAAFPEGIPAVIVDRAQKDLTSLVQMFEANSGKNFLPLEEAAAYQRMKDAGMTLKAICAAVGRAQVHVSGMLDLMKAGDDLKGAVADGSVSKTTAKDIAKVAKGDKTKQAELVAQAKAVGKDKTKRSSLRRSLDNTKVAKAKSKGKVVKIRALDNNELSAIGSSMASRLSDEMKNNGFDLDSDMYAWLKGRAEGYRIAFMFGALEALKVAAGAENKLLTV